MNTTNRIWIRSDRDTVYALAAAVERWAELLPHYRYVRTEQQTAHGPRLKMSAWRSFIPVSWTSVVKRLPEERKVQFRHVGGVTKGMEVEWRLRSHAGGTLVEIVHVLELRWPPILRPAAELVIGRYFVYSIAGRTLARMKQLAEAQGR